MHVIFALVVGFIIYRIFSSIAEAGQQQERNINDLRERIQQIEDKQYKEMLERQYNHKE